MSDAEKFVQTLLRENEMLRAALWRIADYDDQPIWHDDRDDAADDMLRIARVALGLEQEDAGNE